jgi:beta-glucosidase-like glycosyl hydrolase
MCAYNAIDGAPGVRERAAAAEWLAQYWGFNGYGCRLRRDQ